MSEPITALIADDESLGRDLVRHMLGRHPDIQIVAECADGAQALAEINRHAPSVAFLDIRMPRLDGMALLDNLAEGKRPLIVFTTAHDGYALRAFQQHAFDYLLKPFDESRFNQSLSRVRERLRQLAAARMAEAVREALGSPPTVTREERLPPLERVVIRETGRIYFVEVADIEWLEASGNYVALHVAGGKTHLAHETMSHLETRLTARLFVRIHRSVIVRVDRIKELLPHFNGEYIVVLKDNTRLKLSRSYSESARIALGLA